LAFEATLSAERITQLDTRIGDAGNRSVGSLPPSTIATILREIRQHSLFSEYIAIHARSVSTSKARHRSLARTRHLASVNLFGAGGIALDEVNGCLYARVGNAGNGEISQLRTPVGM
jgi:hypothetical protein